MGSALITRLKINSAGNLQPKVSTQGFTVYNNVWNTAVDNAGTAFINMFKLNTSDEMDIGAPLNAGPIEFVADSGVVTAMNMPVTSASSDGLEMSYAFAVGSNPILKVRALSDGAGGADEFLVVAEQGVFSMKETTTPTAVADYGAVYSKSDNGLYFQDGAGFEHHVSLLDTFIGEMYTYEAIQTITINTSGVYHAINGLSTGDVSNFTFNAGRQVDANIATESDATQLQITTSAAHNLMSGDVVVLTNMNNAAHNKPTLVSVIDGTNFTCDDITYVGGAGASAGVVDEPSYLKAGSGGAGKYLCNFSLSGYSSVAAKNFKIEVFVDSTENNKIVAEITPSGTAIQDSSGSGVVTITDGEKIWLAIENNTDTTNFVLEHCNLNLHRL